MKNNKIFSILFSIYKIYLNIVRNFNIFMIVKISKLQRKIII